LVFDAVAPDDYVQIGNARDTSGPNPPDVIASRRTFEPEID
jgi:hypothetical protein